VKRNTNILQITFFFILFPVIIHAQVADFSADVYEGCSPLTVHFTNEGSTGVIYTYDWTFGSVGTSTDENPTFDFVNSGNYEIRLIVTDTGTSQTDTAFGEINVILTPSANLAIDQTNACINGDVVFHYGFAAKDSILCDFGDGTVTLVEDVPSFITHEYESNGSFPVQFTTYYQTCSDISPVYNVNVSGPTAEFSMSAEEGCKGAEITFSLDSATGVTSFDWDVGEGPLLYDSIVQHSYDTVGIIIVKLNLEGAGDCTIDDTIQIYNVTADFNYGDSYFCPQSTVRFYNTSTENDNNAWDFGNGSSSFIEEPVQIFLPGTYVISLEVSNDFGCTDSKTDTIVIHELPEISFGATYYAFCEGESVQLEASGGDEIIWYPGTGLDDTTSYTPTATPQNSIVYNALITDSETHCSNTGQITVLIQNEIEPGKISVMPADSSIIIGDSIQVTTIDSLDRILIYSWTPDAQISCTDCPGPLIQPLESTVYRLEVSDTNFCFDPQVFDVNIEVVTEYRIGVPNAFTPNGDGVNDEIKVDGWGVKRLIEFRIYNRWGTEVFATDSMDEGWDGTYNGKLQGIDSYAYFIKAEMWDDNVIVRKGTFSLIH
jgi:gliding motility-associated-like protein